MTSLFKAQGMVNDFHAKYGYNISSGIVVNGVEVRKPPPGFVPPLRLVPRLVSGDEAMFRVRLISEESAELFAAMEKKQLVMIADSLADLTYVVIGTADYYGIPLSPVFDEVHRSNMTKEYSVEFGKPIKGPTFSPPKLAEILIKAGAAI